MVDLSAIVTYLDSLLDPQLYTDDAINGLQVDSGNKSVSRIAVAVDAGESIIRNAVSSGAHLLVVHHGLFWGGTPALTGILSSKIRMLMQSGCSLYASHLPLDGNLRVGNAAELARFLELVEIQPAFQYQGRTLGVRASCPSSRNANDFVAHANSLIGARSPLLFPFGASEIRTVGIVTGSGSSFIPTCAEQQLDLFITGEPKHQAYQLSKELRLSALFAGHYATETLGVRALLKLMEEHFKLSGIFIDDPSGI